MGRPWSIAPRGTGRISSRTPILFLGLVAMAGAFGCQTQDPDLVDSGRLEIQGMLDKVILPVIAEHEVPGMALGVVVGDRGHVVTYGLASVKDSIPVRPGTLFEIGSVSKVFTGAMAVYAEAVGHLTLQDRTGRHLPELRGHPIEQASLLHLGTYTAGGLPLQFPEEVSGHRDMMDYFARWEPEAAPGKVRRYSNPSIGLLGHVSARALGRAFPLVLSDLILEPMELSHTHIEVPEWAMAAYAWGYDGEDRPVRVGPAVFDAEAYGVKSSALDMVRFLQANLDPSRLDGPLRRSIEGTQVGYFRVGGMVQGLGWEQYPYPVPVEDLLAGNAPSMIFEAQPAVALSPPSRPSSSSLFMKTGSTNGFGTFVAFLPEEGVGVVILANRNLPIPARVRAGYQILERLTAPPSHSTVPSSGYPGAGRGGGPAGSPI